VRRFECLNSLFHLDHDRITTQTQHQPLPLCDQMHDNAVSVLQPQVTPARSAYGEAVATLNVRSSEVA
jgi:hypothetical protein